MDGARLELDPTDKPRIRREPQRPCALAPCSACWQRIAFDKQTLIDERLNDTGDGRTVNADEAGELGATRRAEIEQSLNNAAAIGMTHLGGRDQRMGAVVWPARERQARRLLAPVDTGQELPLGDNAALAVG